MTNSNDETIEMPQQGGSQFNAQEAARLLQERREQSNQRTYINTLLQSLKHTGVPIVLVFVLFIILVWFVWFLLDLGQTMVNFNKMMEEATKILKKISAGELQINNKLGQQREFIEPIDTPIQTTIQPE